MLKRHTLANGHLVCVSIFRIHQSVLPLLGCLISFTCGGATSVRIRCVFDTAVLSVQSLNFNGTSNFEPPKLKLRMLKGPGGLRSFESNERLVTCGYKDSAVRLVTCCGNWRYSAVPFANFAVLGRQELLLAKSEEMQ